MGGEGSPQLPLELERARVANQQPRPAVLGEEVRADECPELGRARVA